MTFLNVPYAEKDQARELGARWNPTRKRWYVPPGVALEPFARWMPQEGEAALERDTRAARLVTGARYVEIDHACNPFEPCAQCAPVLAQSGWAAAREDVLKTLRTLAQAR
jgi:Domain of unknown function (DUF5710)